MADLGETKAINDEEAKCMQSINQYSNNLMSFDAEFSKLPAKNGEVAVITLVSSLMSKRIQRLDVELKMMTEEDRP